MAGIFSRYESALRSCNAVVRRSILLTLRLFADPALSCREVYRYVLVTIPDTNAAQFRLVRR
jgi:hypothetical protein